MLLWRCRAADKMTYIFLSMHYGNYCMNSPTRLHYFWLKFNYVVIFSKLQLDPVLYCLYYRLTSHKYIVLLLYPVCFVCFISI